MGKRGIKPRCFTPEEIAFAKESLGRLGKAKAIELFNTRFAPPIGMGHMKRLARIAGIKLYLPPGPGRARYKPIGTERIEEQKSRGCIRRICLVKTADGKWKNKLPLAWEEANGKIPHGHFVISLDRNPANASPDNLYLISRAELGVMNSLNLFSTDPDATKLGLAVAKMRIAASRRIRESTTARDLWQFKATKDIGKFKNRK